MITVRRPAEKSAGARFNAVDLLVVALILLTAFSAVAYAALRGGNDRQYRLTLDLDPAEAEQMEQAGIRMSRGDKVYSADGELLGTLESDRASAQTALPVILVSGALERGKFLPGDRLSVRIDGIRTGSAVIAAIEEVNGS